MIDIKINSKEIKQGDTFISLKSIKGNEKNYIDEAIENGANKIIIEKDKIERIYVSNTKKYLENYLKEKYYKKIENIKLIGITGTSGKTTTAYLTYQMLKGLKQKCAYIGTIGFWTNKKIKDLNNTTPDIYDIYEMLLYCKKKKIKYVIMEVSSIALEMGRLNTLLFDEVCFTNLSKEHMDFHKNMKSYFNSKKKLFNMLKNNKICVINKSKYGKKLLKLDNNNILLNEKEISNVKLYLDKSSFTYKYKNNSYNLKINLVGYYNIMNYIDALLLVIHLGFNINDIIKIKVKSPKGRMELVTYKNNSIFIDYAHKPDAVLKVLNLANTIKKNKVYVVIGCGGNRDKTKRPIMGKIATSKSDYVIFTNDNPRNEEPKEILKDITKNLTKKNFEIIEDREEAIKKGIDLLKNNDILLILGKGHEEYQIIKNNKYYFSDMKCTLKYIN